MDWNKLSTSDKIKISKQRPIFISGSIDISENRIKNIIAKLNTKNVIWGSIKDSYINGLEDSEQFKTLSHEKLEQNLSNIQILEYYQRDWKYILKELNLSGAILINGSWNRALHHREEFWTILNKKIPYKLISPFDKEKEAIALSKDYVMKEKIFHEKVIGRKLKTEKEIYAILDKVKSLSFDWTGQVGALLVRDNEIVEYSYNKVVPYQTYAMHFGSSREKNFTPLNDQNHYDTNHAEIGMIIKAKDKLKDSTLYINVMPCPTCARALCQTELKEIKYRLDHSEGYAVNVLERSGKKITKLT